MATTGQRVGLTRGEKYLCALSLLLIFIRPSHCALHLDKPYRYVIKSSARKVTALQLNVLFGDRLNCLT